MSDPSLTDLLDVSDVLEGVRTPISPANPCGEDVTYDPDFESLKAQIDLLGSVYAGNVDYDVVVTLGQRVLREKSKDLRVACYLAMGLMRTRGPMGLAEGIAIVEGLASSFWEDLYPTKRRMVGRRNALQSLSDWLKEWVADVKPAPEDREALEYALERLKALQAFCMGAMEDQAPALSGLAQALEAALRRVPKPAAVAEAAPEPAAAARPSVAASPAAATVALKPVGSGEGFRSVVEAERSAVRIVDYLREQDAANPVPYRLIRLLRWSVLRQEPPHENGKTLLPPPDLQRATVLASLLDRGEFALVAQEAENAFHEAPFWLDMQRFVVQAMDALGAAFQPARDAVLFETAMLLRRLPGLSGLTFSDGTPFAGAQTQGWIETRVQPFLGAEQRQAPPVVMGDQAPVDAQYQEARKQLGAGDLASALAVLQEGAEQDATGRERFRRRLYVASLCLSGGQLAVARSLLVRLDEEIQRHGLAAWEPTLALQVWSGLYKCLITLAKGNADAERKTQLAQAEQIFDRICALDPTYGLSLLGK